MDPRFTVANFIRVIIYVRYRKSSKNIVYNPPYSCNEVNMGGGWQATCYEGRFCRTIHSRPFFRGGVPG